MANERLTGLLVRLDSEEIFFFSAAFLDEHRAEIQVDADEGGAYAGAPAGLAELRESLRTSAPVLFAVQNALYVEDQELTELNASGDGVPDGARPGKPVGPVLSDLMQDGLPTPSEFFE